MSQKKHSAEWIIGRVEEYIDGKGSYSEISRSNGIGKTTLIRWVSKYRAGGVEVFAEKSGCARYSKEFKRQCVEAVIRGEGSINEITAKYNISHDSVLSRWIMRYNANMELKDYDPKREVYMAESRRKTTQ